MTFSVAEERLTAISDDGASMGYILFPRIKAGLVNIREVTVLPAFRAQGVADAMLEELFIRLDRQGLKAALTCPFAQRYVGQHPQWKKILPGEIHFTKY